MKLSIIIPVYNEEKTLKEIIRKVKRAELPKGVTKEIIAIDDGSRDQSLKILLREKGIRALIHKKNKGKGAAVRWGLKEASGDFLLIQDADLEYDPNDYIKLLEPILKKKAKVVYGTRLKDYPVKIFGEKHIPFLSHFLGNKLLTSITNLLYASNLTDMETCYKLFTKEVLKSFRLNSNRFEFEPEITAKILKAKYNIHEVAIRVTPRGYDEGKKITWKDGFLAVWTLIKYRFND